MFLNILFLSFFELTLFLFVFRLVLEVCHVSQTNGKQIQNELSQTLNVLFNQLFSVSFNLKSKHIGAVGKHAWFTMGV
jgi:hypothetical protein